MNTVNHHPTDNCGICTPFPDFHACLQMLPDCTLSACIMQLLTFFLSFPRSSRRSGDEYRHSQHRYGVRSQYGKCVIITSFFFFFLTIAGRMINATYAPVRGNTLHHHWGSPLRCCLVFVCSWSHASTCGFKGNDRFCLRIDCVDLSGGFSYSDDWIDSVISSTIKLTKQSNN